MTILPNIEEAMEDARNGKLSPYWQNDLKRECLHRKLSDEERQALSEPNRILSETPQWSGEEELCIEMENIGGRVRFCHFWDEHYSMVQLTEDRNGKYSAAYVLDVETTPDVRKVAALQAQKELADCMQVWGVSLLDAPVSVQNVGSIKSAVAIFRQLHRGVVFLPVVAIPDSAADVRHVMMQFFFAAPLRSFGQNALQFRKSLLFFVR